MVVVVVVSLVENVVLLLLGGGGDDGCFAAFVVPSFVKTYLSVQFQIASYSGFVFLGKIAAATRTVLR